MTGSIALKEIADGPVNGFHHERHNEIIECLTMVGDSAWNAKDWTAAKRAYSLVLSLDPKHTHALNRLGRCELIAKDPGAAVERFSDAFIAGAKNPATCVNLACAYTRLKDYTQGLYWCEAALTEDPAFLSAYIQKASIYELLGDYEAVTEIYRLAVSLHPESAEVKFGLGVQLLREGNYREGWPLYQNRPDRMRLCDKLDEYPEWQGEDLNGKTILVCGEQGFGDRIMFARYLPLLVALGANVVLFEAPEVARLIALAFPDIRIVTSDREVIGLEPDYWVAAGSLPLQWRAFEQIEIVGTPQNGALSLPYLWADRPVSLPGANLKVGLCWKGAAKHMHDALRSIPWAQMKELLGVSGVDYCSLQYGLDESEIPSLVNTSHDLLDTARQIAGLDLVVTVDTAILHLAGAMGIPALGLLYQPTDWRWGLEGSTTPWYSSVKLFRQEESGAWRPALERVRKEVTRRAEEHHNRAALGDVRESTSESWRGGIRSASCRYGPMFWPANDHYIGRALDLYREYSDSEMELLRQVLQPGDIVIEAGANVGGLTFGMAEAVGPAGRVYAFEPQPFYFQCLSAHAPENVIRYCNPLGAECRTVRIRAVEEQAIHAPGWPSRGPEFEAGQVTVDGLTLERVALLKVDVDGPEHEILKGAEQTIDRCRPVIYVEYDKPECYPGMLEWIAAKDYRLYQHAAPLYNPDNVRAYHVNVFGNLVSLMVLCVPNERKDLKFPDLPRIRAERAQ